MRIDKIVECLDRIRILVQVSNVAYLMTEDDKTALAEAKEILENLEAEKERIIKELEEATVIYKDCLGRGFEVIPKWKTIEIVKRQEGEV